MVKHGIDWARIAALGRGEAGRLVAAHGPGLVRSGVDYATRVIADAVKALHSKVLSDERKVTAAERVDYMAAQTDGICGPFLSLETYAPTATDLNSYHWFNTSSATSLSVYKIRPSGLNSGSSADRLTLGTRYAEFCGIDVDIVAMEFMIDYQVVSPQTQPLQSSWKFRHIILELLDVENGVDSDAGVPAPIQLFVQPCHIATLWPKNMQGVNASGTYGQPRGSKTHPGFWSKFRPKWDDGIASAAWTPAAAYTNVTQSLQPAFLQSPAQDVDATYIASLDQVAELNAYRSSSPYNFNVVDDWTVEVDLTIGAQLPSVSSSSATTAVALMPSASVVGGVATLEAKRTHTVKFGKRVSFRALSASGDTVASSATIAYPDRRFVLLTFDDDYSYNTGGATANHVCKAYLRSVRQVGERCARTWAAEQTGLPGPTHSLHMDGRSAYLHGTTEAQVGPHPPRPGSLA